MLIYGTEPTRFEKVGLPSLKGNQPKLVPVNDILSMMTSWNINRQRFRYKPKNEKIHELDTPARSYAWAFYRDMLENNNLGYLIKKFDMDRAMINISTAKQLSEFAKKKGTIADVNWRFLVDIHRLNDYLPYVTEDKFEDDIRDWVQRKPQHTWNGDEDKWYRKFADEVRGLLERSGKKPDVIMTPDEFVMNGDIWCTSGSGFEPDYREKIKILNVNKNEEVTPTKNKWAVMWSLSKYKLKRLLFKKRLQICKAVQKSEPGKVRAVISSDLSLYLKMTYCSLWFDQVFRGSTESTLWMSKKDKFMLWQKMASDGTWRMPLDQSEFDKNVSLRQVKIIVDEMTKYARKMLAPEVVLELMELISYSISAGYVFVNGKSIEIRNGVLSGWRWTAFFDTVVNICELRMATDWAREAGVEPGLIDYNAQGDDDWTKFKTRKGAIAVWLAYQSFGLDVNPSKFFLDTIRDEYLRRVYDKGIVTGYPARSVSSILWRNPISEKEVTGAERCRSIFNKWKLFAERCDRTMDRTWFFRQYKKDAIGGTVGMTNDILEDWLKQNIMMGGISLDGGVLSVGLVPTTSEVTVDKLDFSTLDGYQEWLKYVKQIGVTEHNAYTFAASTMNFDRARKYPKWIKYIYTYDTLNIQHIPFGLDTNRPGTVAIGRQAYWQAKIKRWKWFPTILDLKNTVHYGKWGLQECSYTTGTFISLPITVDSVKVPRLEPIDGYSITSCRLSSEPKLAFKNYESFKEKRKPKSWTIDYIQGRLKAKVSPRTGWGIDAVGFLGDVLLSKAITIFLSANKGGLALWDRLLASIDVTIPIILSTLRVRVVE